MEKEITLDNEMDVEKSLETLIREWYGKLS